MSDATAVLASFVADQAGRDLPRSAETAARKVVLDAVGCALAGIAASHSKAARRASAGLSAASADATVIGEARRRPADLAAFSNTLSARAHLFDDTYGPGHMHAGAALTFTALALGQTVDATVGDFLQSIAVGAEIAARVGTAASYAHYVRGFHNTGTCTVFGTAATAAYLLGLDAPACHTALSLAGEYASGLRQYQIDGDAAISALHAANAARNGIMAAYLAIEGFPAANEMLEGKMGFLTCFGAEEGASASLTSGLGNTWAIEQMSIKPFPSCRGTHGAGTAATDLIGQHDVVPDSVTAVRVRVPEDEFVLCNRPRPTTPLDAQFSIQYVVAHVLARHSLTVNDFDDSHLTDSTVQRLAEKVTVLADPELHGTASSVEVSQGDGNALVQDVVASRGDPDNPFQSAQLEAKFIGNASGVLTTSAARELIGFISSASAGTPLSTMDSLLTVAAGHTSKGNAGLSS